jgi:glycosyltransferase involved in cell wall biosynthesis
MLASADLLFIGQRSGVVASVLPGKLLHYMAAGRPILAAVHPLSATARLVAEAGCGVVVPAEDPGTLAGAIDRLGAAPGELQALGRSGRYFAERCFAREAILPRYIDLLERHEPQESYRRAS